MIIKIINVDKSSSSYQLLFVHLNPSQSEESPTAVFSVRSF